MKQKWVHYTSTKPTLSADEIYDGYRQGWNLWLKPFFCWIKAKGWREHLSPNQLIQSVFNYINRMVFP